MARIGWVEFEEADGHLRDLYLREAAGRPDVAGIVKSFSQRVEALEGMLKLSEVHFGQHGALGRTRREMIATYVSAINGCRY